MYQLYYSPRKTVENAVISISKSLCIPFDPANTDYAEFKKAVTAGAELQDADGNTMSSEAAQTFVRGLP